MLYKKNLSSEVRAILLDKNTTVLWVMTHWTRKDSGPLAYLSKSTSSPFADGLRCRSDTRWPVPCRI